MNAELSRPCPICAGQQSIPFLTTSGYLIVRCARCSFLFVDPPPTAAALHQFYQQGAYYAGSELGYGDYLGQRSQHEQLARRRLEQIERIVPTRGALLDVGCAAGFFLHVAQRRGWTVSGVELAQEMASQARQLIGQPVVPTLADLAAPLEAFDAISAWEYIEHIPEPGAEISKLAAFLRPGGVLALSTPNTGYWSAVYRPNEWREFKPPAHLGFFTEHTLRQAIEAAGLQVIVLPKLVTRAPSHPVLLRAPLALLRRLGNRADKKTPLWWIFSLTWRLVERLSQLYYQARWPGSQLQIGLEVYARKA